jgi:hypothetical protein
MMRKMVRSTQGVMTLVMVMIMELRVNPGAGMIRTTTIMLNANSLDDDTIPVTSRRRVNLDINDMTRRTTTKRK